MTSRSIDPRVSERSIQHPTKDSMGYRVESRYREEPVVPTITLSSRQYVAMVKDLTRRLQGDLIPSKAQTYSTPICPKKQVNNGSRSLLFSGTSKDPEEYLQWESSMEKWLQSQNLSKEEKLAQAASALTRKAREWWLKESTPTTYKKPVLDWRDLKGQMYKEFVEKYQSTPMRLAPTSFPPMIFAPSKPPTIKGESEEVKDDAKVLLVKNTTTNQELGLRSNPVKGGEDGVILISLKFRDIEDPNLQTTNGPEGDMRPINRAYKMNQED